MSFKNYVYISKGKLNVYFPQTLRLHGELTTSLKVKAGPIEASVSGKETTPEMHEKLDEIVSSLKRRGELGTIGDDCEWFEGEIFAGSIMDGRQLFFGGRIEETGKPIDLVLLCSLENMIGSEYHKVRGDYHSQTETVGPTRSRQYNINSNNYQFATTLSNLFRIEGLTVAANFEVPHQESIFLQQFRLTDSERAAMQDKPYWNRLVMSILQGEAWGLFNLSGLFGSDLPRPQASLFKKLANLIVKPVARLMLGSELYRAKKQAVGRSYVFEHLKKETLEKEEREVLRNAYSFLSSATEGRVRYQYVARRLLQGFRVEPARDLLYTSRRPSNGEYISQTVIASPLYLAIVSRY